VEVGKGFLTKTYHQNLHHMYNDQREEGRKYTVNQKVRMILQFCMRLKSSSNKRYKRE